MNRKLYSIALLSTLCLYHFAYGAGASSQENWGESKTVLQSSPVLHLSELPEEVILKIFSYLDFDGLNKLRAAGKPFVFYSPLKTEIVRKMPTHNKLVRYYETNKALPFDHVSIKRIEIIEAENSNSQDALNVRIIPHVRITPFIHLFKNLEILSLVNSKGLGSLFF